MLPRAQRLTTREFARAFEQSLVLRHPLLQLRAHRRGEGGEVRAAFVVPKKTGKATRRNRTRRRVRERFRLMLPTWRERLGDCDLIFLAAPAAEAATQGQLDEALVALLERAVRSSGRAPKSAGRRFGPSVAKGA